MGKDTLPLMGFEVFAQLMPKTRKAIRELGELCEQEAGALHEHGLVLRRIELNWAHKEFSEVTVEVRPKEEHCDEHTRIAQSDQR